MAVYRKPVRANWNKRWWHGLPRTGQSTDRVFEKQAYPKPKAPRNYVESRARAETLRSNRVKTGACVNTQAEIEPRPYIYIYIYILSFAYYTSLKYVRVLLLGISLCPWDLSNDVWVLAGLWSNQKSQNNRRLHRSPDFSVNSKLMGIPRGLLDVLYKFYHFLPKEDTVPVSTWTSLTLCNVAEFR